MFYLPSNTATSADKALEVYHLRLSLKYIVNIYMSKASLCLTQDGIPNVDDDDDNYDNDDDDNEC